MAVFRQIPILRVLLPYCLGLLISLLSGIGFSGKAWLFAAALLWLVSALAYFIHSRTNAPPVPGVIFVFSLSLCIFLCGISTAGLARPEDPGFPVKSELLVFGRVENEPVESGRSRVCYLKMEGLIFDDTLIREKSRLRVYLDTLMMQDLPQRGEWWYMQGSLYSIQNSATPGGPDYRAVFGRKDCWYRFYVSGKKGALYKRVEGAKALSAAAISARISGQWKGNAGDIALLKAVCFGDRAALPSHLKEAYTAAGGMHLLAVSGLHVGLIWWVLQHATNWMISLFRKEIYRGILVLSLLWGYAFLTGLSSSVFRSVCMFSLFSTARMMGRSLASMNVLLVSALILLALKPVRLFDVGFQLSYLAMIGILLLYQVIRSRIVVKGSLRKWLADGVVLSLSAQLATAPLVIYYFHQLPLYSVLTSLVSIPLLSLLIVLFVLSSPFLLLGIDPILPGWLMMKIAGLMNLVMKLVAELPVSLLGGLKLEPWTVVALLILLFLIQQLLQEYTVRRVVLCLGLSCFLLFAYSFKRLAFDSSSDLSVADFRGATVISVREGREIDHFVWRGDSAANSYMHAYLQGYGGRKVSTCFVEPVDGEPCAGKVAIAIPVDHGLWFLGNDGNSMLFRCQNP